MDIKREILKPGHRTALLDPTTQEASGRRS